MAEKITSHSLQYPVGYEPNFIIPVDYCEYRFAIGKQVTNPLVAICMNPSAVKAELSDYTTNRISKDLEMDGWIVFNTYPERATNASNIEGYDEALSKQNIQVIRDFLTEHNIIEVWGAWGDDQNYSPLYKGKCELLSMLNSINVKVFYYGTLTKAQNSRHPLQRNEAGNFTSENKYYL